MTMSIKPELGDVVLTYNLDSNLSKLIGKVTNSKWSHTALYIGYGQIIESTIGGVQISPFKKYLDGKHDIAILRLKASPEIKKEVIRRASDYLGKKYGYLQLLWYLFLRLIRRSEKPRMQKDLQPRAMVCSEAIARALKDVGLEVKPRFKPSGVEPVDFLQSELFEVVTIIYHNQL